MNYLKATKHLYNNYQRTSLYQHKMHQFITKLEILFNYKKMINAYLNITIVFEGCLILAKLLKLSLIITK